jgi:hypothetical protein
VNIPRKPHPNGLLLYMCASYQIHPTKPHKKIPFIVDILPHIQVGDSAPILAVQQIIKR